MTKSKPQIVCDHPEVIRLFKLFGVYIDEATADHEDFPTLTEVDDRYFQVPKKLSTYVVIHPDYIEETETYLTEKKAQQEGVLVDKATPAQLTGRDKNLLELPTPDRCQMYLRDEFNSIVYPATVQYMRPVIGKRYSDQHHNTRLIVVWRYFNDNTERVGSALYAEPSQVSQEEWTYSPPARGEVQEVVTWPLVFYPVLRTERNKKVLRAVAVHPSGKVIIYKDSFRGEMPPFFTKTRVEIHERRGCFLTLPYGASVDSPDEVVEALICHDGEDEIGDLQYIIGGQIIDIEPWLNAQCRLKDFAFSLQMTRNQFSRGAKSLRASFHPDRFQKRSKAILNMKEKIYKDLSAALDKYEMALMVEWHKQETARTDAVEAARKKVEEQKKNGASANV